MAGGNLTTLGREEERGLRLERINEALKVRGLKPLKRLGDQTKGEWEILGINSVHDHSARFFTDIKFDALMPNGQTGNFTVRFNAHSDKTDGAVMVAMLNGYVAIVKQWRLPLGRWTLELPRGFGDKLDALHAKFLVGEEFSADELKASPLGTAFRELGEEVSKTANIKNVVPLGNIAQDSGTHAGEPAYYLIDLDVDPKLLDEKIREHNASGEETTVQFWPLNKAWNEIGGKIRCNFSITGLALTVKYIQNLSQHAPKVVI